MNELANNWQAADARQHFSEVVGAAVEGNPQFVRRRDGKEVVIVSREYFERTRPSLKALLLSFQFGHDGDEFDQALEEGRGVVGQLFMPRESEGLFDDDGDTGHERSE